MVIFRDQSLLSHFSFLAHLAHGCELRPDVIDLHPVEFVFVADFSDFFGLEHPTRLVGIFLVFLRRALFAADSLVLVLTRFYNMLLETDLVDLIL